MSSSLSAAAMAQKVQPKRGSGNILDFIPELARGKRVLDVGCVDHTIANAQMKISDGTWLHDRMCKTASSVVGLDYSLEGVQALNAMGYNIVHGDAMTIDLGEQFDVVNCGEIIEHLENPGIFLRNMVRHIRPGGRLVVTTPNAYFALHMVEAIFANRYNRWNHEHTQWFDYFTLGNLFDRVGLSIEECRHFARSRKTQAVLNAIGAGCPAILASTLVMVGRPK
jgi:2-polyprenyl-3-methyl-5-hydroxy-6-metoxy-1,4-benzoquinol methylase